MNIPLFALDFETTGLDPDQDGVLEVGLAGDGTYSSLVSDAPLSSRAARAIHGISHEEARRTGKKGNVVLAELLAFLGEEPVRIVAHNVPFEQAFLESWARKAGMALPEIEWICTLAEARELCRDPSISKGLGNLVARFGWRAGILHRAEADAAATLRLHHFMLAWRDVLIQLAGQQKAIYLAGPVRGDGHPRTIRYNQERMFAMAQWTQGVLPQAALIVPHGNFAFLDESSPKNLGVRERILESCARLVTRCDALILCGEVLSPGMLHERDAALASGIPIFSVPGWDVPVWNEAPINSVA